MTNPTSDDLDAVRTIVAALQTFDAKDQERIIRWAREKLGLLYSVDATLPTAPSNFPVTSTTLSTNVHRDSASTDIKTFVDSKKPTSDVQFAATVAYYYRFEAPESERKEMINGADLREASRKVNRKRLSDPADTLHNAHKLGLLDKGSERGNYSINSVGENLVAMTLPQQTLTRDVVHRRKPKSKAKPKIQKGKSR